MSNPMRVLHVEMGMIRAGIETMIMNYYRNIDRSMIQFDFAGYRTEKCDYDDEIRSLGGIFFYYPQYKIYNHRAFVKWWETFFQEHPEYRIIHNHAEGTYGIVSKIAKKYGRYVIVHSHSARGIELPTPKSILFHISSISTRKTADYFFGCSEKAILDKFGKKILNDSSKSSVIHNAIDSKKYKYNHELRNRMRESLGIKENTLVVGTVGRIDRPKNPLFICKILEYMNDQDIEYCFLWIGSGPWDRRIKERVKNLGDKVLFLGIRANVSDYLQAMDVFIMPSLWEGFSVSCAEAQATGTPTLMSDSCSKEMGITDVCRFIPNNDTELWCEEIRKAANLGKKNTSNQIEEAGYEIANEASKLVDFYENAVKDIRKYNYCS